MAQRYCFAPNCTSGYKSNKEKVSFFKVPKNKLKEWSVVIPRADKQLKNHDVLCEKHFFKEDVIREVVTESYSYPLKRPRLRENAEPSIWPNCPSYLSKKFIKKRRIIQRHEYVPPAKRKKNQNPSDTNKDRSSIKEVPDAPSTSLVYDHNLSANINIEDNASWLCKLYNKLCKNKITLPSESWTIKFHHNIIAILETAVNADDIIVKKRIVLSQSCLNFFVFQHLHERLTEKSDNKIDDVGDFEEKLKLFDELSICYGFLINDGFTVELNKKLSLYRKDEFSKSIRHKNCQYLLSAGDHLRKNVDHCLLCRNAKNAILYSKTKVTQSTMSRDSLFRKNATNCLKRERRIKYTIDRLKKELQEAKEKMETVFKKMEVQKQM